MTPWPSWVLPMAAHVALAWTFAAGRVLHSAVQIPTRNVRLRGIVFTVNFLAVPGLWALVVGKAVDPATA